MAAIPLLLGMLMLAMTGHAKCTWCVCRDLPDAVLQKALDYACGAGADCNPTRQNGPCFQPNTVRAHCSYAVNSYYQKKGQSQGSCDFSGSATVSTSDPSVNGCSYPATASATTVTTSNPKTGGTGTGTSTGTGPGTGTGTTTTTVPNSSSNNNNMNNNPYSSSTGTGIGNGNGNGLGSSGSGGFPDLNDSAAAANLRPPLSSSLLITVAITTFSLVTYFDSLLLSKR